MISNQQIFKNGSTTYYFSSKFFSAEVKEDVFKLYSFVRIADNFVDDIPQDKNSFDRLANDWQTICFQGKIAGKDNDVITQVVNNMYEVSQKYHFDPAWTNAFLDSMRMDLNKTSYKTMQDTLTYIYGSAEVIGLMMARILGADGGINSQTASHMLNSDSQDQDFHTFGTYGIKQAASKAVLITKKVSKRRRTVQDKAEAVQHYARLQGRAMQYINFIRDIAEDIELGRCYFPDSELRKYGIDNVTQRTAMRNPAAFREFIDGQLTYYQAWQDEASKGFRAIPFRQRIALRTAVDMYNWTAQQLADDPLVVFEKKIKPSKYRVISRAVVRFFNA